MRLELTNFLQYTSKVFTFPDVGVVRLNGISGAGKTTIMKAIDYAINGTPVKRSWAGGVPAVTLDFPALDLKITRTGTQTSTLAVWTEGNEFRDAAAQAQIFLKICGSRERFHVSSYIRQRMKGALINLGPADQLRLIQSLAFGDENPETTKVKIAGILKDKNTAVTVETELLKNKQASALSLKERAADVRASIVEPTPPCDPAAMASATQLLDTHQQILQKLYAGTRDIADKLANTLYATLATATQTLVQISDRRNAIASRRHEIEQRLKDIETEALALGPEPVVDMVALEAKRRYLDAMEQAKGLVAAVRSAHPGFAAGPLGAWLESELALTSAKIAEIEPLITQTSAEYHALKGAEDGQPCPVCQTPLAVRSGVIHKHEGAADKEGLLETLGADLASYNKQLADLRQYTSVLLGYQTRSTELKALLKTDPLPDVPSKESADGHLSRAIGYAAAISKLKTEKEALTLERSTQEIELGSLDKKEAEVTAQIAEAKELEPQDQLREQQRQISERITQTEREVAELRSLVEKIEQYAAEMLKVQNAKAVLAEIEAQVVAAEQAVADQQKVVAEAQEQVGAWTRMRELSDKAAVSAVEETISDINGNAQSYIGRLFPDDGTTVRILNTTRNQKGDERAKLSLEIRHKGFDAGKNDEDLSGGEQDRIALSFQLAMSDLYGSPILMVDEGFAGADVEKTLQLGLTVLKEYSANKLVLVIQHGAHDEFFDEVIDID